MKKALQPTGFQILWSSLQLFREAIGKLLSDVQGDPDMARQAQVIKSLSGNKNPCILGEEADRAVY